MLHIVKSKENINYFKYRIILFIIGLIVIIFSESSLKLIEDSLIENIKLILAPFLIILTLYLTLLYQLKIKFNF